MTASFEHSGLIRLAILAVGGQGGGVLSNWIVDLAERNGYIAQSTSVPGVAQRTGATIYYVELLPDTSSPPVLALMPSPGDVDIVIAAEIMEAGRAVTRGLVTPDRTTLIASNHRMHAVSEKVVPGDGVIGNGLVLPHIQAAAHRLICCDFAAIAADTGSHISASLLGALAGSDALPFDRAAFEATITASGRGVEPSLRAFGAAYAAARAPAPSPSPHMPAPDHAAPRAPDVAHLPDPVQDMASAGLARVIDYQDTAYGQEYLDHLASAARADAAQGGDAHQFAYTSTLAKYLANAMCYDDIPRVADLKTRSRRTARVRDELGVPSDAVLQLTEYFHPRTDELLSLLPTRVGLWVESRPALVRGIARLFSKGRRLRSDRLVPFLMLYWLAGQRRRRRGMLRHHRELAHMQAWLGCASQLLPLNYDLAVETLGTRRLIKGYSDTHTRGLAKFDRVMQGIALVQNRTDAADWARRLKTAALADVDGTQLDGVIQTIQSFSGTQAAE
ncbi:indolepyruvate oxidoreductase subunit beta family protein [Aliisedimentitalea scapharcae]|uniref:Indolepyruvate oxidoreductase subunit beta family protein n=1 Tax=Aliisedimentitalea scapharcae TaxID=1524259 RepID=A0ABZ2XTZ9_9RHOB